MAMKKRQSRFPNKKNDNQKSRTPTPPDYKAVKEKKVAEKEAGSVIRLNRFIANCGVCSRRDADRLIADGLIKVNGNVIAEMGYRVQPTDTVYYQGKQLLREKLVYVLLNKPKDHITTTEDPQERRTVMNLVSNACEERIFPVGRLDRNTTGLLLLTNDGELAKKLSHPSHNIRKVYEATLDKPLSKDDFIKIRDGFDLEDGPVKIDDIAISVEDDNKVGIELHIGRNRIVRRIFEHFGYDVVRLDRVVYAGLSKYNLPRGKWRYLTDTEVGRLLRYK